MAEPVPHPGSLLQSLILAPTGLSQSVLARHLGFNQPQPVNELIKGRRGITPKMALLLERFTDGDYPAEFWLLAQLRWDLSEARKTIPAARLAMIQSMDASEDAASIAASAGLSQLLAASAQL